MKSDNERMQVLQRDAKYNVKQRLLNARQAADYLGLKSTKQLWLWVCDGKLPQIKIPGARPAYDINDLNSLIETNRQYHDSLITSQNIRKEINGGGK